MTQPKRYLCVLPYLQESSVYSELRLLTVLKLEGGKVSSAAGKQ